MSETIFDTVIYLGENMTLAIFGFLTLSGILPMLFVILMLYYPDIFNNYVVSMLYELDKEENPIENDSI